MYITIYTLSEFLLILSLFHLFIKKFLHKYKFDFKNKLFFKLYFYSLVYFFLVRKIAILS